MKIWIKNISMILGIIIILLVAVSIFLQLVTRHNKEIVVPDFTNMSISEAELLAQKGELRLDITDSVYIKRIPRGHISRQNPEPGSMVKKGRRILLTINSNLPQTVEMPQLVGYSLRQAKTELISNGLTIGKLVYEPDMATNNVLKQMCGGTEIEAGTIIETDTVIDLVLGMNISDTTTFIPNVKGYKLTLAKDLLNDNSLNINKITFDESVVTYSDTLNAVVFSQIPAPSDSIQYRLGTYVEVCLTIDQEKLIEPETPETEDEL